MTLEECIKKEFKDLDLYFYGVQLNVTDNGDLQKLASQMITMVQSDNPFDEDFGQIYPVALLANMASINKTLKNLKAGSLDELDNKTIIDSVELISQNPDFFEEFLKEVEALRAEPTTD